MFASLLFEQIVGRDPDQKLKQRPAPSAAPGSRPQNDLPSPALLLPEQHPVGRPAADLQDETGLCSMCDLMLTHYIMSDTCVKEINEVAYYVVI